METGAFRDWIEQRFIQSDAGHMSPCWAWQRNISDQGYGLVVASRWTGHTRKVRAHRLAYEMLVGPVPQGMELDHLCRNRSCINPAHLEPVTHRENIIRAVAARCELGRLACGHEDTPQNTVAKGSALCCRTCHNARQRAYNARKAAKREDNVLRVKFGNVAGKAA